MSHWMSSFSRKVKYVDPDTFTTHFGWEKSGARSGAGEEVVCESAPLSSVAQEFGRPTYLYSRAAFDDAYEEMPQWLGARPHTLCFAVQSYGTLSIPLHIGHRGRGFGMC